MADSSSAAAAPAPEDIPWYDLATKNLQTLKQQLTQRLQEEIEKIEKQNRENPNWYPQSPILYWAVVGGYVLAQVVLLCFTLPNAFNAGGVTEALGVPLNIALLALVLQTGHLAFSIRMVRVDWLVGISFYGRPLYPPIKEGKQAISGLYVVPFGILQFFKAGRNYRDKRFPGPADKIYRVSKEQQKMREGGDAPPPGFVRPVIVTTGEAELSKEERLAREKGKPFNPLDRQLPVEAAWFVRYRPDQKLGGIFRIVRNLSAKTDEGDIDSRIDDLIQEQSERDVKSIFSMLTPATVIKNWDLASEVFILKLRLNVIHLGIDIDSGSGLDDMNPSHETNEEQANVARAEFKKLATITTAEADKRKAVLLGEGEAGALQAKLYAQAKGYKKIADETGIDGSAVIASETSKTALGDKTVVLGTEGIAQVFGLVKTGAEALRALQAKKEPTDAGTS